jgi:RNA polymerase sigma factor (sigma-70 family)
MKRSYRSRWDDGDEPPSAPAGERSSGVCFRAVPPPLVAGPCASFEEVHQRYGPYVLRRIRGRIPYDESGAEDVFQKVFRRLDRRICDTKRVPHPIVPTLLGLIDDEILNYKRSLRRQRCDGPPDSEMPSSKPDPEQIADRAELQRDVHAIFSLMSTAEVDLLERVHGDEEPQKDIAQTLGITLAALRKRLQRARATFAELYKRHYGSRRRP